MRGFPLLPPALNPPALKALDLGESLSALPRLETSQPKKRLDARIRETDRTSHSDDPLGLQGQEQLEGIQALRPEVPLALPRRGVAVLKHQTESGERIRDRPFLLLDLTAQLQLTASQQPAGLG